MIPDFDGLREVVHFENGFQVLLYRNQEAEDYPRHWHSDIEMILPLEGGYGVLIDDKQYDLNENDILLIPPGVIHELFAPEKGSRMILQISYAVTSEIDRFYDGLKRFYPCLYISADELEKDDGAYRQIRLLLDIMIAEYENPGAFAAASLKSVAQLLLIQCARQWETFGAEQGSRRYAKSVDGFLRVCDHIHRHCAEPLTVQQLADVAGYSKSHFVRMFKEFSNISCIEYIQQQRVALSRQMLADPEMSIAEIVARSGFGSVASFNRVFKAQMHLTPSRYRQLLRQKAATPEKNDAAKGA